MKTSRTPAAVPIVTRSRLVQDLRVLGVEPGMTVMLHASVREVGWVVGGPDVVLQGLLDVLGPEGTLLMYVGWEDGPYHLDTWDHERWRAYLRECPPFDPARSRADRRYSILTEYLRTWPGALRSDHPEASLAAVGKLASHLTRDHVRNYAFGPGSPLHRFVTAQGRVLLLGSPMEKVTLIHLAENLANVGPKRVVRYRMPVLQFGDRVWESFEDFDTSNGILHWAGDDYFGIIVRTYLAAGFGREGWVGGAHSLLLEGPGLVEFATGWMEANLGM